MILKVIQIIAKELNQSILSNLAIVLNTNALPVIVVIAM